MKGLNGLTIEGFELLPTKQISIFVKTRKCLPSRYTEVYSELSRTFQMELFAKTVNGSKLLTVFVKNAFSHVWQGSKYASW